MDVEAFGGYHAADYGDLLEVFFAEVGPVGADYVEQAAYDLGHAVEVAGTHCSFHDLGYGAEVEDACVGLGVYFFDGGDEGVVDACVGEAPAVGFFGTRVGAQVVGVVELCGVDEYAYDDDVVFATGAVDE